MNTPSIKKNFVYSTAYQILTMAVPFITTPYVSRVLGADGIGIYSFTSSVVAFFTMFAALGVMSYGAREISRVRNNRSLLSRLFWEIELLVAFSTAVCLLLWGVWMICAPKYNVIYLILSMSIIGVVADISWFFTGLEQFKYIVLRNSTVKFLGTISLFVFIREKDDLNLYIFLMTLINLLGAFSMWMYIPQMVDRVNWSTLHVRKHFGETLVYFIPTIATSLYTILNKVLLGFIGDDIRDNGYYEQANRIINICQMLTFTALNRVLGARIAFLFVENKIEEIQKRIEKSLHYILFTGLGLIFGLQALTPRFVPWFFGAGFEPVIFLLQLLSPIILIIGISNCLGSQYYTPAGLRKQSARYIIVGAVVNLVLNLILIPYFGAIGAVSGSLVAELTITCLYVYNCGEYLTLSQLGRNGWRKVIAGILMYLVISSISCTIDNNTVFCIVSVIIGVFTYILILVLMHDKFALDLVSMLKKHKM